MRRARRTGRASTLGARASPALAHDLGGSSSGRCRARLQPDARVDRPGCVYDLIGRGGGVRVDADLDTHATALYVRTDDLLKLYPEQVPYRPQVGIAPQISDAEIITLSVMQALLGHGSQARWLRHATAHLKHLFPYLPEQPGHNKRLRKLAGTVNWLIGMLGRDTSVWTDDVWVVDSTPVECGRSRETTRRSDLAGWAEYGYCANHSRYFWGPRSTAAVLSRPCRRRFS